MKKIRNNLYLFNMYFRLDPLYSIMKLTSSVFAIIQPLTSIYFFKLFLDGIFVHKSLVYCLNIVGIMVFLSSVAYVWEIVLNNKLTPISFQKISTIKVKELLNLYLKIDMKTLNNPEFYDKYQQVISDIPNRMMSVQDNICSFLGNIFAVTTVITLMIQIDWFMIVIVIVGVAIDLYVSPIVNKLSYKSYLEKTPKERELSYIKRIFYMFEYAKELKILPFSDILLKKYDTRNSELVKIINKYATKSVILWLISGAINIGIFGLIMAYLTFSAFKNALSMGEVGSLYNATEQLKYNISNILNIFPKFDEHSRYIENYKSILEIKSEIDTVDSDIEEFEEIELNNISFKYDEKGEDTMKNISFSIKKGVKIAFIGENGAGKSTLINLIFRLYEVSNGDILYNGKSYKDISVKKLREQFTVILQDCNSYAVSIAENILLRKVENKEDEKKVNDALKKVGLYDKVSKLKNGIHTILSKEFDDNGVIFSGGETQRLMACKIFVLDTPIIILDEITSNIDALSENQIFSEIEEYIQDKTVIYVTHRLSLTKNVDQIYVIGNGEIIQKGNHKELVNINGKYKEMFKGQADKYE